MVKTVSFLITDLRGGGAERITVNLANDLVAVSYTHLRAHETVLDLVCRILLEKKNTCLKYTHQTS